MCGRLACTLCPDDIVSNIHKDTQIRNGTSDEKLEDSEMPLWIERQYEYTPIYNGAPTSVLPVLVNKDALNLSEDENSAEASYQGKYCIIPMRWDMVLPNKSESTSSTFHTHNARLENILNSQLYKPCLFSGKRCVILADGYYEWQTTKGENHKQPYYIYQQPNVKESGDEKYLMKFAGLFNSIKDESGIKHTCTMLTKEADSSLTWMHHRMPILLNTAKDISSWLDSKNVNHTEALKLLPDYSMCPKEYKLQYHMVDKSYVNNSSCNSEKCMQRMSIKRKSTTLDSWLMKK